MNIKRNIDSLEFFCKTIKWLRENYENSIEEADCKNIWLYSNRLENELIFSQEICMNIINDFFFDKLPADFQEEIWEFHVEIYNELDY